MSTDRILIASNLMVAAANLMVIAICVILLSSMPAHADTNREVVMDCDSVGARSNDVAALACNIYHEARGESVPGQWLVGLATLNRVLSKIYPNTFSEVVYEIRRDKNTGKRVAMFSWVLDGKHDLVYNKKRWMTALQIAGRIVGSHTGVSEKVTDITYGCMWYHHVDISPYWMKSYHPTVRIQNHQCYAVNERAYLKALGQDLPDLEYAHK